LISIRNHEFLINWELHPHFVKFGQVILLFYAGRFPPLQ